MMYGGEKSDPAIVAGRPTNKVASATAESVEPRAGAERNAGQQSTRRTQGRERVSQALERVRQVSPSETRGGSRVRECRSRGSVRGAISNDRPYRDSWRALIVRSTSDNGRGRATSTRTLRATFCREQLQQDCEITGSVC